MTNKKSTKLIELGGFLKGKEVDKEERVLFILS